MSWNISPSFAPSSTPAAYAATREELEAVHQANALDERASTPRSRKGSVTSSRPFDSEASKSKKTGIGASLKQVFRGPPDQEMGRGSPGRNVPQLLDDKHVVVSSPSAYWKAQPALASDSRDKPGRDGEDVSHGNDLKTSRNERQKLQKTAKELHDENNVLKGKIRMLQADAYKSVEPAEWSLPSSSDIERLFTGIAKDIRHWSEKFATESPEVLFQPDTIDRLRDTLYFARCMYSVQTLRRKVLARKKPIKGFAALLLSSVITTKLWKWVFDKTFFAYQRHSEDDRRRVGDALDQFMGIVSEHDEKRAETWRIQTLRLLNPFMSDNSPEAVGMRSSMTHDIASAAATSARDLIEETTVLLAPQGLEDHALSELASIAVRCGELSSKLWSYRVTLNVLDMPNLCDSPYYSISRPPPPPRYFSSSGLVVPHSLNNIDLDNDELALEGHELVLLCSPAIIATASGEESENGSLRVWKKAIVWVD